MRDIKLSDLKLIKLDFIDNYYRNSAEFLLHKLLPPDYSSIEDIAQKKTFLFEKAPFIIWEHIGKRVICRMLCRKNKNNMEQSPFFYDLVSKWLFPSKKVAVELYFTKDFEFFEDIDDKYTIFEIILKFDEEINEKDFDEKKKNIETELRLGVTSKFHANRIMQFKGLSYDKKTALIQEKIAHLVHGKSKDFGQNIFSHMQHFLVTCSDLFKLERDYHHISRLISVVYLMKKMLVERIKVAPYKRHVFFKILKTTITSNGEKKNVLGLILGLNFIKEREVFEKKHLLSAIKTTIPYFNEVENSFLLDKSIDIPIQTMYIEIEKSGDFTLSEIDTIKDKLPDEIRMHIESFMHKLFMPENEEEIVRNILTLSRQLRFVNDMPQVIIKFENEMDKDLCFNIILVRVLKHHSQPVIEMLDKNKNHVKYVFDRVKKVGLIRRRYFREASVFKMIVPSSKYIRKDRSIDLNIARSDIVEHLNHIFGEIRDYNGGMIFKQNEALSKLKEALLSIKEYDEMLLEKFFYSIRPTEMNCILDTNILKNIYLMLVNTINREQSRISKRNDYLFKKEDNQISVILPAATISNKKMIKDFIFKYYLLSTDFISFDMQINEIYYIGFIFNSDDELRQKNFLKIVQQALDVIEKK